MKFFLVLFEYLGLFSTAVFTAVGALAHSDNPRTKQSIKRITLAGIAISLLISLVSKTTDLMIKGREAVEAAEQARDLAGNASVAATEAKHAAVAGTEAAQRTEVILTEVRRIVTPIKDVRLSMQANITIDHPRLVPYRKRLLEGVEKLLAANVGRLRDLPGIAISGRMNGEVRWIDVVDGEKSPFFPKSEGDELVVHDIWTFWPMKLQFHRSDPIDPDKFETTKIVFRGPPRPDLSMRADYPALNPKDEKQPAKLRLAYNVMDKTLAVDVFDMPAEIDPNRTGLLESIDDLRGAQLFICTDIDTTSDDGRDEARKDIRFATVPWTFSLQIGDRRLNLQQGLEHKTDPIKRPYFYFRFPEKVEEFNEVTR